MLMGLSAEQKCSGTNKMGNKIIDLMTYRIEKTLKENGFTLKMDGDNKVKLLIKLSEDERGVKP